MSSKAKEQLKQLKAPDQFQVQVMSGLDWVIKRRALLLLALLPIAIVAVGYVIYQWQQEAQRDARVKELGQAQIAYENEERQATEQREAIQKKIDELQVKLAPPTAPKAGETPAAVDPKLMAEKAALEQQVNSIKADHAGSLKLFQDFFKAHSQTAEGWMAGMTAAAIFIDQKNLAAAASVLEEILAKADKSHFYQTQARFTYVGILEDQGNFDKALAEIETLEKIAAPELKPKVLLAKGRVQLLKDQKAEAKSTFDTLIEGHSASPEAQKARSIQALFN